MRSGKSGLRALLRILPLVCLIPRCEAVAQASPSGTGQDFNSLRRPIPGPVPVRRIPWNRLAASGSATETTLKLSASAVPAGTAVTLSAMVVSGKTDVTPGILDFCHAESAACTGSARMATAVLNAQGVAEATIRLAAGSYSIRARFEGSTPYAASESAAESLTVEANSNYATKAVFTEVTGTKGKYALGATLASHAPMAPRGSLVFADTTDKKKLGSAALPGSVLSGYQPFGLITTGAKSGPNDLVVGDFNGDGIPDLAAPDSATGVVAVFLGKGDGTFQPAKFASTGTGSMPLALAAADFNADGKLDLAVALGNQGAVAILLGNGDGTFQPPRLVTTAGSALYHPVALTVGDFNHDGRLDIATANNTLGASVLLGTGDGSFQPYRLLGSSDGPTWIAAGDFNDDGDLDVAITTSSNTVDISLGNGDGTFRAYTSVATGSGTNPQSIAISDLDNDGNLDLIVACYGANAVGVLLGNGDGTFLPIELYPAGAEPIAVTIGDLNLDGIPDLVVTNLGSNSLSLFQGNGDGTFLPLPGYSTTGGSQPAASVIADLDGEGAPEIVTVLYGSSALYLLESERMQGVVLKDVALSTAKTIDLKVSYAGDDLYAPAKSTAYAFPVASESGKNIVRLVPRGPKPARNSKQGPRVGSQG